MKRLLVPLAACLLAFSAQAQEAEDPFADAVEMRHGLMLQMTTDISKLGAMAKGDAAYDAPAATRAASNVAAIASVLSMDQFPAGSEAGKAADSFALPAIWTNPDGFMARIADMNAAAATMVAASGTNLASLQGGMAGLGGACSACHKDFRQPEE